MENKSSDKHIWDKLGKILAVLITLIYIVNISNGIWNYVPADSVWSNIIHYGLFYGPMALILIVTFEAVADKNNLIRILFILFWVAIILFSISPTLWGLIRV
ncbi:MAG: hypothetical protein IJS74_01285 [Clostridia bacterium]|nr:hypothetical protein [Clostridia bacterium]